MHACVGSEEASVDWRCTTGEVASVRVGSICGRRVALFEEYIHSALAIRTCRRMSADLCRPYVTFRYVRLPTFCLASIPRLPEHMHRRRTWHDTHIHIYTYICIHVCVVALSLQTPMYLDGGARLSASPLAKESDKEWSPREASSSAFSSYVILSRSVE